MSLQDLHVFMRDTFNNNNFQSATSSGAFWLRTHFTRQACKHAIRFLFSSFFERFIFQYRDLQLVHCGIALLMNRMWVVSGLFQSYCSNIRF